MMKFIRKMVAMACVASLVVTLGAAFSPSEKVSAGSNISSISFQSAGPHYLYEGEDQYWDKDDQCYYYYLPDFLDGDQIIINLKDGTKDIFTYDSEYDDFLNEDDDYLDFWEDDDWGVENDDYYPNLWQPGKHSFDLVYCGEFRCTLPVVVVGSQQPTQNPTQSPSYITNISFKSAGTHYLYEGKDQNWDDVDECYYYHLPDFLDGDQIIITLADGTKDIFTYDSEYEDFFDEDDYYLDFWDDDDWGVDNDEYYPNLWQPGNHSFVIDYCDKFKFILPVLVIGSQPTTQAIIPPAPVYPSVVPAPAPAPAAKILSKVTGLKVKNTKKKTIKVSWRRVTNARNYLVKVGNKSFKTTKTSKVVKNKKFKVGKKVKVRVRAMASGYTSGAWATKKVKIKK